MTFKRDGSINRAVSTPVVKIQVKRKAITAADRSECMYDCNTAVILMYFALRLMRGLKLICAEHLSDKDKKNKRVLEYLKNCHNAETLMYFWLNDIFNYTPYEEGYKRTNMIFSFAYDAAYTPLCMMKGAAFQFYKKYIISKDLLSVTIQATVAKHVTLMALRAIDDAVNKWSWLYPKLNEFFHQLDFSNAYLELCHAHSFLTKDADGNIDTDQDFYNVKVKLGNFVCDKEFYPMVCRGQNIDLYIK